MDGQEPSIHDLLRRRLDLVAGLSALTAKTHKFIQETAGVEMEILRLQLELGRNTANGALLHNLREVEQQAEDIRSHHENCIAEIEEAEAAVRQIDQLIAAARGE